MVVGFLVTVVLALLLLYIFNQIDNKNNEVPVDANVAGSSANLFSS